MHHGTPQLMELRVNVDRPTCLLRVMLGPPHLIELRVVLGLPLLLELRVNAVLLDVNITLGA